MVIHELEPLLKVSQVARMLHVHENTVRRWSDHGIIKSFRIARRGDRRFRREDIKRYIEDNYGQAR